MDITNNNQASRSYASQLSFKKSPKKYTLGESRTEDLNFGYSSTRINGNSWADNDFKNIKKVSDDFSSLRQTFDTKANSNIRQKLAKYNLEEQNPKNQSNQGENILRQTFHTKLSSPISPMHKYLNNQSDYDKAFTKEEASNSSTKNLIYKSPAARQTAKQGIEQKFKKYVQASEKIK